MTIQISNARVTGRIVRTENSKTDYEYEAGGLSYLSVEAVEAAPEAGHLPTRSRLKTSRKTFLSGFRPVYWYSETAS